jgi:hypothetical protein
VSGEPGSGQVCGQILAALPLDAARVPARPCRAPAGRVGDRERRSAESDVCGGPLGGGAPSATDAVRTGEGVVSERFRRDGWSQDVAARRVTSLAIRAATNTVVWHYIAGLLAGLALTRAEIGKRLSRPRTCGPTPANATAGSRAGQGHRLPRQR